MRRLSYFLLGVLIAFSIGLIADAQSTTVEAQVKNDVKVSAPAAEEVHEVKPLPKQATPITKKLEAPKPKPLSTPMFAIGNDINVGNILALINTARTATSSLPLEIDGTLMQVAQAKADDEVKRQYFSHTNPEGEHVWGAITSAGYEYRIAGENLAVAFNTVQEEQQKWMDSPKHRDNLLDSRYEDIGIGIARGTYQGKDVLYVVTLFGQKKSNEKN